MPEITLKKWELKDAKTLAKIANNKHVLPNLEPGTPNPFTEKDAIKCIEEMIKIEPPVHFAIIYKGKIVGGVECRPNKLPDCIAMEVGCFVDYEYWSNRIGREALSLIMKYVVSTFGIKHFWAETKRENIAANKIAHYNGFYTTLILDKVIWEKYIT